MRTIFLLFPLSLLLAGPTTIVDWPPRTDCCVASDQDITLVDNREGPRFGEPLFDLEPDLTLGIDEGEPAWQIFGRAVFFDVMPNGEMHIYSAPNTDGMLIVSSDGDLLMKTLPPGSGPGEGRGVIGSWWIDGGRELWSYDSNLHRITRFTPLGELLGTVLIAEQSTQWASLWQLKNRRFLGSRRARDAQGIRQGIMEYGFLNEDFSWQRTILRLPPSSIEPKWWRAGDLEMGLPFSTVNFLVSYPSGRIAWGDTDAGVITLLDIEGRPTRRFRREWELPKITAEDREVFLREVEQRSPKYLPAARRARLPERWGYFWWPEVDDRERLWVPRGRPVYEEGRKAGFVYDVFDTLGIWLGTQTLPVPHNELQIQNGYLYMAINRDDRSPRLHRFRMVSRFEGLKP